METRLLADVPAAITLLAPAFKAHWASDKPDSYLAETEAAFRQCLNRDALPLMLVTTDEHEVLGCVGLFARSVHSRPQLGPWLGALFVFPSHRRQGIGLLLIEAAERQASTLGLPTLYAGTETAVSLFKRRNWNIVEEGVEESGERLTIFCCQPSQRRRPNQAASASSSMSRWS